MSQHDRGPWRQAAAFAVPITALILALMLAWFTFGNRYVVFLTYHDMGPQVPDTGPFSPVTRSRYWMTGLVAAGAVLALTTAAHLALGRLQRGYRPPAWWRIWLLCALPLLAGIPAITMLTHSPRLPGWLAALTTASTLTGLALALIPGHLAATRPLDAALLGLDGGALALCLTVLPGIEHLSEWIAQGRRGYLLMLALLPAAGFAGLIVLSLLRLRLRQTMPAARDLGLAALIVAYLVLPLVHHILGTAGRFYITDMDNFFARDPAVQGFTFLVTGSVVWATTWLRRRMTDT